MSNSFRYYIHWSHGGTIYCDELFAGAKEEVIDIFNQQKRSDVTLVKVELIGPEDMPELVFNHPACMLSGWWNRGYSKAK